MYNCRYDSVADWLESGMKLNKHVRHDRLSRSMTRMCKTILINNPDNLMIACC